MRVISGKARGSILVAPAGFETRPTGDRMKEDLFNILNHRLKDIVFLDLYCGSGAIGIEALSRGARSAVFVDCSKAAIDATKANLRKTHLLEMAEIFFMPVHQVCGAQEFQGRQFDIIFLDPPYDSAELPAALDSIKNLLAEDGIVIAECRRGLGFELPDIPGLGIYRQKKYGQMQFVFYEKM